MTYVITFKQSLLNCCQCSSEETKDEPFAWEAREFLRKKLIGKEVVFTVEYKVPSTGREYGFLYLGKGLTKLLII